jgi:hypothetical protein
MSLKINAVLLHPFMTAAGTPGLIFYLGLFGLFLWVVACVVAFFGRVVFEDLMKS